MTDSGLIAYPQAAPTYFEAGWRGVLPLEHRTKWPPPKGFTGYEGVDPSYPDILAWGEQYPHGNVCLRLPDGVIGIDVDAYGAKTGAAALEEAKRRWGYLPDGPRSANRDDEVSGIRLFRVPPGTLLEQWIVFPELGVGDIEIVQHHHRYVVCWPSIHREGREYWWHNELGQIIGIPGPDELPWLPQRWIDGLRITRHSAVLNGAPYDVVGAMTDGSPSALVAQRLSQAISEMNLLGQSRHDTTLRHVLALLRLGKDGQPGIRRALELLGAAFVAVVTADGSRSASEAEKEFDRMVTNPNAARELAQPGLLDWMRAIVIENEPEPEPKPEPSSEPSARPRSKLEKIEQGFWDSRESLQIIYTAALSRMCSPWAVLAHVIAQTLTTVRPHVVLPPIVGGSGSLNWFAAIAGRSGGGKGSASSAAAALFPHYVDQRNLGSGEGICQQFYKPGNKSQQAEIHDAIMFEAVEIDTMTSLNDRSGQTTMSVLRAGFSGETLGFSYRNNDHHIKAHTYRMTLVLSLQPSRARPLIDAAGGGTPQRFQWFPATDSRVSMDTPWWPGQLHSIPDRQQWIYPRELKVPAEAERMIKMARVADMNDEVGALDGHALFVREKCAYALALLDGRIDMSLQDWELSGVAAAVSDYVREWVSEQLAEIEKSDAEKRGQLMGVSTAASNIARDSHTAERITSVSSSVLRRLEQGPHTNRELAKAIRSDRRYWLDAALVHLSTAGRIGRDKENRWVLI